MGCARLVQTQLHTDNDYTGFDCPGRTVAIVGSRGGQVRGKYHRIGLGINVHGSLQYIPGGNYTYRIELQQQFSATRNYL